MKTRIRTSSLSSTIMAGLVCGLAGHPEAQTFKTLYSFPANGSQEPGWSLLSGTRAGILLSGNTLYGTTCGGPSVGATVFAMNTDGTGFRVLQTFSPISTPAPPNSGRSELRPVLSLSGETLYGTVRFGGSAAMGTVFKVNTDGSGFAELHDFTGNPTDGAHPMVGVVVSGETLYGTTYGGGYFGPPPSELPYQGCGIVFKMNTDGTGYQLLHNFNFNSSIEVESNPHIALVLSDDTLYGATSLDHAVIFRLNTDGTDYRILLHDGEEPLPEIGGLILSGNELYGTKGAYMYDSGEVFKLNTDGTGYTILHTFAPYSHDCDLCTNIDGHGPVGTLLLSGDTLYGETYEGGASGYGTIFAVKTDGTGFTNLYSFAPPESSDNPTGYRPNGNLVMSDNTLYGTMRLGGAFGCGTIFSLSLPTTPPQLMITVAATNILLSWPANSTGLTLRSTTNLAESTFWTTNLPPPVIVNGQNTVTTPISDTKQFFWLSR